MKNLGGAIVYRWRYFFVLLILSCALSGLVSRVIFLSIIDRHFLLNQGDARSERVIDIKAYRGMINDRNNNSLAVSTPVESIWVNPLKLTFTHEQLAQLCHLLDLKISVVSQMLAENSKRGFIYLKRRIDPETASQIKQLQIPGVYSQEEFKRFYPEGEVSAHILGFTNIDDKGEAGIELAYDNWLHGIPGKQRVLKDRYGHVIANLGKLRDPHPGHDLTLSIDQRLQFIAFKALSEQVQEFAADSGSAVVLDSKTGEVLAMVNVPSFNPNEANIKPGAEQRNRAVTDTFEPGSAMKAFSIASIIASGKYKPDSLIDTGKGYIPVGHNIVRDIHPIGIASVRTVLQKSSNVGTAKMILSLPPENLWKTLKAVGFGESTHTGFPGERSGSLSRHRISSPFLLATLAFGYGVTVTPLQLVHAYSVIANHGVSVPVTLLKRTQAVPEKQVMDPKVAATMLDMMQAVLEPGGSGTAARVPGYHVAGKTGTARLVGPHGYEPHKHMAVFAGIAPVSDPRLVIVVAIKNPTKKAYYGGTVSGPVFAKIMASALHILNIPPDDLPATISPVTY